MNQLIGRQKEIARLERRFQSNSSEFIVIYGRRRVGKTFLVRQVLEEHFVFHLTGIANVGMRDQLVQFHSELRRRSDNSSFLFADNWFAAFQQLIDYLEALPSSGKKVLFLDELPWLDTRNSKFLSALEHFWNSWASARSDILLIVCGSAASWMIKNLLNNRGGLHNRLTDRIKLEPFSLQETELFLKSKNVAYDRYQIILIYMVFGGIPYYLDFIQSHLSAAQNINELCFETNALFRSEYGNLYASLFSQSERHIAVVEALAQKNKGLKRNEIQRLTKLPDGGSLSKILKELEESSFIRKYSAFGKKSKESLYQLVDMYSLFYLNFIQKIGQDEELFWMNIQDTSAFYAWSGYAFEMVCLHHVTQIKKALGISGVGTSISTWQSKKAQIDLLIDRRDRVINLCEMKFSIHPFKITKIQAESLRNKIGTFKSETKTSKAIFLTLITTFGLAESPYKGMVQNELSMDVLFEGQ
ncbi:MAG: ATP-binding protein [Bacteroidota bacterium]